MSEHTEMAVPTKSPSFYNTIPLHHKARHDQYSVCSRVPRNLQWLYNCNHSVDLFTKYLTTVYYANNFMMILYMWHKDSVVAKIELTITEPGDNDNFETKVVITEKLGKTKTKEYTVGINQLKDILSYQGCKIGQQ